jgi:hypothetical protein
MPTVFAARSDQSAPCESFREDAHVNVRSDTIGGAIVTAGGSKQLSVVSKTSGVATRYDKLAINFLSAVILAAIIAFWV